MLMRNDFAVFVMSYKRANSITTIKLLRKSNYTGKIYVVVGDDDPTIDEYKEIYGDDVIVFSKDEIKEEIDTYDNFDNKISIVYARNACFKIAEELGLNYFLQMDDDYIELGYRYPKDGQLKIATVKEFDELCDAFIEYLEEANLTSVAFAQNGDFIGGINSGLVKSKVKRKAMNSWFCSTKKKFKFAGTLNDDVNTYIGLGKLGNVFLTIKDVSLKQKHTQQNAGGITDLYLNYGTYMKSFYTVLANPSCVVVYPIRDKYVRLHHRINWNKAVPKIVSDKYKK